MEVDGDAERWELRLYVAGETPRSVAALANLRRICEEHLAGKYSIEVIDLLERPQLARGEQIIAIPTLERRLPEPVRKIIGDLSNTERVLIGLDLRPERLRRPTIGADAMVTTRAARHPADGGRPGRPRPADQRLEHGGRDPLRPPRGPSPPAPRSSSSSSTRTTATAPPPCSPAPPRAGRGRATSGSAAATAPSSSARSASRRPAPRSASAWLATDGIDQGLAEQERSVLLSAERAARSTAEEALGLVEAILTSAPVGIAVFDLDLRYVRVNDAYAELSGVPADDHIGGQLGDVVPLQADVAADLRRVVTTGRTILGRSVELVTGSTEHRPAVLHRQLLPGPHHGRRPRRRRPHPRRGHRGQAGRGRAGRAAPDGPRPPTSACRSWPRPARC